MFVQPSPSGEGFFFSPLASRGGVAVCFHHYPPATSSSGEDPTMNTRSLLFLLPLAIGCQSDLEVTPEVEAAIAAMNDATTGTLFAAELMTNFNESESAAAAKDDPCPTVVRETGQVVLDYGDGCIPDSGLLLYEMGGTVTLEYSTLQRSVEATLDQLTYDGNSINGTLAASYSLLGGGTGLDIEEAVDLTFMVDGSDIALQQDLLLLLRATYLEATGSLVYQDPLDTFDMTVDTVNFAYDDLWASCPLPNAGAITVDYDTFSVMMEFHADSPSTGEATVTYKGHSGEVNICAYMGYL